MEHTRFSGLAGSHQSFQDQQRHNHERIAGILRSLGESISDSLRAQLDALSKEGSAEFCIQGLVHLGRELGRNGEIEKAGLLLGAVRSQNEFPELQRQAEAEANALNGIGDAGRRTEILIGGFRREAADYRTIVPMLAGTVVGSLAKSAALSSLLGRAPGALLSRGFGAKAAAGLVGYAFEVPVFALTNRALSHGARPLADDFAGSALSLGAIKLAQAASAQFTVPLAKRNPWLASIAGQGTTLLALAGSRRLEESFGLRQPMAGATFWLDTAASLVGLGVGGHLGHRFLGPRFAALQKELEFRAERRAEISGNSSWGMGEVGRQFAWSPAHIPLKAKSGKFLAELTAEPALMSLSGGDAKGASNPYPYVSKESFEYLGLKIDFELVSQIELLNLDRVRDHLKASLLDILLEGRESRIPLKGEVAARLRSDLEMRGRLFEADHELHVRIDANTGKILSFVAALSGKPIIDWNDFPGAAMPAQVSPAPESELQQSAVQARAPDRAAAESESNAATGDSMPAPPTLESRLPAPAQDAEIIPIEPRLPRPEKLTKLQSHIWDMLPNPYTEMTGIEVIRRLNQANILYNPSTIYMALKRLEQRGILQVRAIPNPAVGLPDVRYYRLALAAPLPSVPEPPALAKATSTMPSAADPAAEIPRASGSQPVAVLEAPELAPSEPEVPALTLDQALIDLTELARENHHFETVLESFQRVHLFLEAGEWPASYHQAVSHDLLSEIQEWFGMLASGEVVRPETAQRYLDRFLTGLKTAQGEYQREIERQAMPGSNFGEWQTSQVEAEEEAPLDQSKPRPLRLTPRRERNPWYPVARSFRPREFFIAASLEGRFPKGRTPDTWQSPKIEVPSVAKIAPLQAPEILEPVLSEASLGQGMAWKAVEQRIATLMRERVAPHYEAFGLRRAQDYFRALVKVRRELPAAQANFLLDIFETTLGDGSQVAQQAGATLETMLRFRPFLALLRRMHRMGGAEQHWAAQADAKFRALVHPALLSGSQLAKAVERLENELRDNGGLHSNRPDRSGRTMELDFDDAKLSPPIAPKPVPLEGTGMPANSDASVKLPEPVRIQSATELPNVPIQASPEFYVRHIEKRLQSARQLFKDKTPEVVKAEANRLIDAIADKFWAEKYAYLADFRRELGKARELIAGAVDEASYGPLTMVEALKSFSSELGAKPAPDLVALQDFRLKSWFWLMRNDQH